MRIETGEPIGFGMALLCQICVAVALGSVTIVIGFLIDPLMITMKVAVDGSTCTLGLRARYGQVTYFTARVRNDLDGEQRQSEC